jgi:xylan 1,4-beta-xylosidase
MNSATATPFALAALLALSAACNTTRAAEVDFEHFSYRGNDPVFELPLPPGHFRNPILAGFYPDPSITRAGDRFYLVHSTFAWFPGIPVFESRDLVHWNQIGSVIDRAGQLDYSGLGVSRGVFAPTIEHHDGTFYVFNTAVDNGGNFLVTATDPSGPWSDPIWLRDIDGIDPSLFVDEDGQGYVLNNGPPEGEPRYDGHRAIWMQAFDLDTKQPTGPRRVLIDGGVDPSTNPIWIEGPHIYRRNGWYYLVCAEGGTGPQHSQVVLRSREVWGPYVPFEHNPILTQRGLDPARPHPITNAGHADLVQIADGSWWATFLSSRTYGEVHYNTGRETFLLPVQWQDDWPRILPPDTPIPSVLPAPALMTAAAEQAPNSGNFSWDDRFDGPGLDRAWLSLRGPSNEWADLASRPGWLRLRAQPLGLDAPGTPSLLGRRLQHQVFEAGLKLAPPAEAGVSAGLVAFQNETHWYFLGLRRDGDRLQVFLHKRAGAVVEAVAELALSEAALADLDTVSLQVRGDQAVYRFGYDLGDGWQALGPPQDGRILSTDVAGGFVGAVLGPYARIETQ